MRPSLLVHIVFHPESTAGLELARSIHGALNADPMVPGVRVPTTFCPVVEGRPPSSLDVDQADRSFVVVLADVHLATDDEWCSFVADVWSHCDESAEHRCLPFELDSGVFPLDDRMADASFVRAFGTADESIETSTQRNLVTRRVTLELCRFLSNEAVGVGDSPEAPTQLFLSHTKMDIASEPMVFDALKDALSNDQPIKTWIDSGDIEGGSRFAEKIAEGVEDSSLLCILTNNYASREWCRREVLLAKKEQRPIVLVDALTTQEIRSFPYLGNIPVVRWTGDAQPVIDLVLKETLRSLHVRSELSRLRREGETVFTRPPELLTMLQQSATTTVLYPDPPLGVEETEALETTGIHITTPLQRLTEDRTLEGMRIALSMSESADIARFGFDGIHLSSTMLELARYLLVKGATLVYGGHLGDDGYTEQLTELVRAHNSVAGVDPVNRLENYVGWPLPLDKHMQLKYKSVAKLKRVARPGDVTEALHPDFVAEPEAFFPATISPEHRYAWARGMTEMRVAQTESVDARVVLGGTIGPTVKQLPDGTRKQSWYASRIPGVLEEVLLSAAAGQPVFLLGAFGGVPELVMNVLDGDMPEEMTWEFHKNAPHAPAMRELYESEGVEWRDYPEMVATLRDLGLGGLNRLIDEAEHRSLFNARHPMAMLEPLLAGLARAR